MLKNPTTLLMQLETSLSDFFTEDRDKTSNSKANDLQEVSLTDHIQVDEQYKEPDPLKAHYKPPLNRTISYCSEDVEKFRERQQKLNEALRSPDDKLKRRTVRPTYIDHQLNPFYLVETIDSITYEIVPYVSEIQRDYPIKVDKRTGFVSNPKELLEYILEDPLKRCFCFVHHDHDPIHVLGKYRDANTRQYNIRVFASRYFPSTWIGS